MEASAEQNLEEAKIFFGRFDGDHRADQLTFKNYVSRVYQVYQDYQDYQVYQNEKNLSLALRRAISRHDPHRRRGRRPLCVIQYMGIVM